MKSSVKLIFFLTLLVFITSKNTFSQIIPSLEYQGSRNAIFFTPTSLAQSTFQVGYERFFKNNQSIVVSSGILISKEHEFSELGFVLEAQYRKYLFNRVFPTSSNRIYIAPFATNKYINGFEYVEDETKSGYLNIATVGFKTGWVFTFSRRFNTDIFIGTGLVKSWNEGHNFDGVYKGADFTRIAFDIGLSFGFWL